MRRKNVREQRKKSAADNIPNLKDGNQKLKSFEQLINEIRRSNSIANVRVLRPKLLFINGLVKQIADPEILRTQEFLGQYGNIQKITITKEKETFYNAFVEYSSEVEAGLVLLALDQFQYKGRVIRVFYGSTKYCFSFLSGQECPVKRCSFSHQFERSFTYFKEASSSINHYRIAERIVKGFAQRLASKTWPRRIFPNPSIALARLKQIQLMDSESSSSLEYSEQFTAAEWEELQREIEGYVQTYEENLPKRRTKVQQFLQYADQQLLSLIFRSSVIDQ